MGAFSSLEVLLCMCVGNGGDAGLEVGSSEPLGVRSLWSFS